MVSKVGVDVIGEVKNGGALGKSIDVTLGAENLDLIRLGIIQNVRHPQFFCVGDLIQLLQVRTILVFEVLGAFIPMGKDANAVGFLHFQ